MTMIELIKTRRSNRSYLNKPVRVGDLKQILEAARFAPSGGNRQRWKFLCATSPEVVRMIKNSSPGFYGDAPVAIVIGLETEVNQPNNMVSILDVGFAAENMLLAAHSLGLGGCAIASFIAQSVKKVIKAPDTFQPILILSIGYPDITPIVPKKKTLSEIVYLNEYGESWSEEVPQ